MARPDTRQVSAADTFRPQIRFGHPLGTGHYLSGQLDGWVVSVVCYGPLGRMFSPSPF